MIVGTVRLVLVRVSSVIFRHRGSICAIDGVVERVDQNMRGMIVETGKEVVSNL